MSNTKLSTARQLAEKFIYFTVSKQESEIAKLVKESGKEELIEALNTKHYWNMTPVQWAYLTNNGFAARLFLTVGASADTRGKDSLSPVKLFNSLNNTYTEKLPDPSKNYSRSEIARLLYLVDMDDMALLQNLLEEGPSNLEYNSPNIANGKNLLMYLVKSKLPFLDKVLNDMAIDESHLKSALSARDNYGHNILHILFRKPGHSIHGQNVVDRILKLRPELLDQKDDSGKTPRRVNSERSGKQFDIQKPRIDIIRFDEPRRVKTVYTPPVETFDTYNRRPSTQNVPGFYSLPAWNRESHHFLFGRENTRNSYPLYQTQTSPVIQGSWFN